MRDEVLEIAACPEITYQSNAIDTQSRRGDDHLLHIHGDLTLHGVTRWQQVMADVWIEGHHVRLLGDLSRCNRTTVSGASRRWPER